MVTETSAEADSSASEADAGVGSRRTTANAERDSVFDRNNQDIGIDEAYQLAALTASRAWNGNEKLTYDNILESLAAQVKEAQTTITNVNAVRLQTLSSMQFNADALAKQHMAHRDIATDRTWTQVNELEVMLAAKSGVQADAFVALLAKSIADAINANK